jgi:hypothetical protein
MEEYKPKRGRKRTPESIQKRLERIDAELSSSDALKRLQLVQERLDLTSELARVSDKVDLTAVEADFVAAAGPYSKRKHISYSAWRELGVSAPVLKKAGISRGSS